MVREVERNGTTKVVTSRLTISYGYEVAGVPYTGDRYSLGSGSTASKRFSDQSKAIAVARQAYPVGQVIDIYCNPAEPNSSVIKLGINIGALVPLVLGCIFLPSGIGLLIYAMQNSSQ